MKYLKNTEVVIEAEEFGPDYFNGNLGLWEIATKEEYEVYIAPLNRLAELHILLKETDYQSAKAFEGVPSDDWEEIKTQRQAWRVELRGLEGE